MTTDLTGVGKVIESLLDAAGRSLGYVLKPWSIRREGYAQIEVEAARIEAIAGAEARAKQRLAQAERAAAAPLGLPDDDAEATNRAGIRVRTRELRATRNVERILGETRERLLEWHPEEAVRPAPIAPDWMDQFMRLAEHISDDDIREIWVRILARQAVASDRKTSLATLDILRLLEPHLAREFQRCVAFTCVFGTCFDTWESEDEATILNTHHTDMHALEEIGFLKRVSIHAPVVVFRNFLIGCFDRAPVRAKRAGGSLQLKPKSFTHDVVNLSWRGTELASVFTPDYLDITNGTLEPTAESGGAFHALEVRRRILLEWGTRLQNFCDRVRVGVSVPTMRDVTSGFEAAFTHEFAGDRWVPLAPSEIEAQLELQGINRQVIDQKMAVLRSIIGD
ncbi:DUF2806 domain-containing protein [Falsiroseomonas ponticola]|uniref:DUF2806 domain-containing protein n=1 Tax=Falsiroseomonas ponticola TaxID=2786951 RepID=UPI00193484E4|nr:DUF2806 domain-containing protein [Roseomonas ponticola]